MGGYVSAAIGEETAGAGRKEVGKRGGGEDVSIAVGEEVAGVDRREERGARRETSTRQPRAASRWHAIAAAATTFSESTPAPRAAGLIGMRTASSAS